MEISIDQIRNAKKLYKDVTDSLNSEIEIIDCIFTFEKREQQRNTKITGKFIFKEEQPVLSITRPLKKFKNFTHPKEPEINFIEVSKYYKNFIN